MTRMSAHKQAVNKADIWEGRKGMVTCVEMTRDAEDEKTEAESAEKIRAVYHRQHQAAGKQMVRIHMDDIQMAVLKPHTISPCLTQSDVCWNK